MNASAARSHALAVRLFHRIERVQFGADEGHGPHTLLLTFRDDTSAERRLFDLTPLLDTGMFRELKDPAYFRRAYVDTENGTVAWPHGQDLNPNRFYDESSPLS